MATSGALSTNNDNIKYKISITQNSQNVTNNTSNVTVSVRFYRTNSGYSTYGTGTVYCKINGTTYTASVTSDDKITSSGIVLFTKTLNITHNADGSKTLSTSAWITHSQVSSSEQSYNQALTTIPRATTPTVSSSSVALGSSVTISTPRASSSFTHTLRYKFINASGTIGSNIGTSKAWTIPLSLANNIPSATSGKLVITCDTYNGSTKIGSKSVTITVTVPASVVPTINSVTVSEGVTDINTKFGAFIKGRSTIKVAISASGAYSSSITSYSSKLNGETYKGSSFSIAKFGASGTFTLSVTITDSRGRKATTTKSINILNYTVPKITKLVANRCDADGTLNDEGEYLSLNYAYTISALNNKNDKAITIRYKLPGASSYTTLKTESLYSANATYVSTAKFDINKAYVISISVVDYFSTMTYETDLSTAFTLVDYHSSGKGMSIGKVAESSDLFDVDLPSRFRKNIEIDSDWVTLTLTSDFKPYNENVANTPKYKVVGGIVNVIGAVSPTVAYSTSTTIVVIATGIPAKYRPPITLNYLCQGSGKNTWLMQVTSSGTITISRYGITDNVDVTTNTWLPFSVCYAI